MNTKGVDNKSLKFSRMIAKIRYIVSIVSTILILLQTALPVLVAAESFNENDVSVTESVDGPVENPVEAPIEMVIEPAAESIAEEAPIDENIESEPIDDSTESEAIDEPVESTPEPESLPAESQAAVTEPVVAKVDFKVSIIWQDGDNVDLLRPGSITIHRLDNQVNHANTANLSAANNWEHTWYGVPADVNYTVDKLNLPSGYTSITDDTNPRHIIIRNSYTPKPKAMLSVASTTSESDVEVSSEESSASEGEAEPDGESESEPAETSSEEISTGDETSTDESSIDETETNDETPTEESSADETTSSEDEEQETSVSGTLTWIDNEDDISTRPKEVVVHLLANGERIASQAITLEDNWSYQFTELPLNSGELAINYSIEIDAVAGYMVELDGFNANLTLAVASRNIGVFAVPPSFSVTVDLVVLPPEEVVINASKVWVDGNNVNGLRPASVIFNLLKDGGPLSSATLASTDNSLTFGTHPYNPATSYVVEETPVPNGYTMTSQMTEEVVYTDPTVTVTLKFLVGEGIPAGNKEYRVSYYANGNFYQTTGVFEIHYKPGDIITFEHIVTLPPGADPTVTEFTGILVETRNKNQNWEPATSNGWQFVGAGVSRRASSLIHNWVITNTLNNVEVSGLKVWDDANNQDGLRPDDVTLVLYADGVSTGKTIVRNEVTGWAFSFTDLPQINSAGNIINYTVVEETVPTGYAVTNVGNMDDGFTITNTHEPAMTSVAGEKTWLDNDDQDGVRPDDIKVNLLANNQKIAEAIVDKDDNWSYEFTNLPLYQNGRIITYAITEDHVPGYSTSYDGFNIINERTPDQVNIRVLKTWSDSNNQDGIRPEIVEVQLLADGVPMGAIVPLSLDVVWTHTWVGLPLNNNGVKIDYSVEEVDIPEGYESEVIDINDGNLFINNSYTPKVRTITGIKTWDDGNDQDGLRPDSVNINLFADGVKIATTQAKKENNWQYEFSNLPVNRAGVAIDYTITEDLVENYQPAVIDGFNITNAREVNTIDIRVLKRWFDANNQDGLRPDSIRVQLYANDVAYGTPETLTFSGNWSHTWLNLPENQAGEAITYTVKELDVPDAYETEVSGLVNGTITLTNAHTPASVDVSGVKTWSDGEDQDGLRPDDVTINLLANNVIIASQIVDETGGWAYSFTNLPKFEDGTLITYTVSENHVQGYSSIVTGFDIENIRTPDVVSFSVFKSWLDNNNQDGLRPEDIKVQLLADDVAIGDPITLTKTNGWTYTWTEMPENKAGQRIDYNVRELNVPTGYESVVTDNDDGNLLITNTHIPETTTINGTKTWNDNDDQDGIRPDSIVVVLYADNLEVGRREAKKLTGWIYSFSNLPVYKAGERITYTVSEDYVQGYSPVVTGFDIRNDHTPDEVSISVFKSWLDRDNQDGIRPDTVKVQLLADGIETGEPVTLTSTGNWQHTWIGLPENSDGTRIDYNVIELDVPEGYESIVTDRDDGNLLITNTHTPETTTVSGAKTWNDNDNQDGIRPDKITVKLFADNVEVNRQDVTEAEGWAYSFTNLPVFAAGERISYTVTEDYVQGYSPVVTGFDIRNDHTPDEVSISVFKSWLDRDNQDGIRPDTIKVQLLADGTATGDPITLTSTGNWQHTWNGLPENSDGTRIDYNVIELDVPEGYESIVTDRDDGNLLITNSHTPEITTVTGTKTWNDNDNQDGIRPDKITVKLFADNVEVNRQDVTEADGWAYSFTNLPVFAAGERITYTVTEDYVPGYSPVVTGFDIRNDHTPDEVSISVFKSWLDRDNQDGIRPDTVKVQLLADGTETGEPVTLTSTGNWQHTWIGLPENSDGTRIDYNVIELDVPEGYESIVTDRDDGNLLITNTHTPETTTVSGAKTWNDNDNQDGIRPDKITVKLFADNVEVNRQDVTEAEGWAYSFTNLPVFAAGERITYTVTEDYVQGYSPVVTGFDIRNDHTPDEVSISVFKSWLDRDNQDGLRPDTVKVQLLADGTETGEPVTLTSTGNWQHTWTSLPENEAGAKIDYSVIELDVPEGYESIVTDRDDGNLLITNSHTPETTTVTGTKTWNDNDNQDGIRPDKITVKLFADNVEVNRQDVTEAEGWAYSFTNLPVFAAGERITYTVTEDYVQGYSPVVTGFDIRNDHTPDEVSISVFKSWLDRDNQDGIRPDTVKVQLLADGTETGEPVTLISTGNWQHTWIGLPENSDGTRIDYNVIELDVPEGYESIVTDRDDGNLLITNSHTPETTTVTGTKTWNDNDNQDGIRPDKITVKLFADNVEVNRQDVTEAEGWAYSFTNLPVFAAGERITYTVTEDYVQGYSPVVTGFDIRNDHTPDEVSISVFKSWLDRDNQDGIRPDTVKVQLLADGTETGEPVTLISTGNWQHTWIGLPENSDGTRIDYNVIELDVPEGYESIVTDRDDGNLLITNSHTPETTTVTGTKTWNDSDNQDGIRPDKITVKLFADNVEVNRQDVTEAEGWAYSFTNLPVFAAGERITYTVSEDYVQGYSPVVTGFDIRNDHTPDEVSISVFKSWLDRDNQDGIRPDTIKVQLLADGTATGDPITLTSTGNWQHTWTALPEKQAGQAIDYSVKELDVPEGYESIVTDRNDGNLLITNTHTPETTTVSGAKTWNDNDNQDGIRPDKITVKLFANNVEVNRQIVTEADAWSYSFTNLPVFAAGKAITYTVTEDYVQGYSPVVTGFDIRNNHTPGEVSISVFKSWLDRDNQDGIRPDTIKVQLLADGTETGEPVTLTSTGNWQHTWTALPEKQAGQAIDYSVKELDVPEGYESIVTDRNDGNLLITNSHTPATTTISGKKTWADNDNQDGVRPEMLTVNLLADGVLVETLEVTQEADWQYAFENLPTHAAGKAILYTVTENTVEGYSTSIEGFDITNTRTPDETSVTVTKSWLDLKDIDGQRPESVEVQLLANAEAVGQPITITEAENWTHTWSNLPLKANGQNITYSILELNLPTGYTAVIDDENHGNIILTNAYTFQSITFSGEKYWADDFDNHFETRPESITVELLQNDQIIASQIVTPDATGRWLYSFDNLDRFDSEGNSYIYTLNEIAIASYTATYDGNNITNTYNVPNLVTIAGAKIWKDDDNKLGKRPDSITVNLIVDGQIIDKQIVKADTSGNWQYNFSELPMYDENGEAILYKVTEVSVAGYETTYDGVDIVNTVIPDPPVEKPRELPSTGEAMPSNWLWGLGILALGTIAVFLGGKRRPEEK